MITLLIISWLYIGIYGYIYWISKRNRHYHKRWKTREVNAIPMMAIFGPLCFAIGYILYNE